MTIHAMSAATSAFTLAAMLVLHVGPALAAPIVGSVDPSSGATDGGTRLTINGIGFSASGNTATVDGNECHVVTETTNQISCDSPEGTGAANPVQVVDGLGEPSNTLNFAYSAPTLSMIAPSSGLTDGGTVITLSGSNFGPASADAVRSVTLGSAACTLVPNGGGHSSVECTTPEGKGTGHSVSITVDGQTSGTVSFSYSPPSISGLNPSSGPTAGGNRLTISGASFGTSASVFVGGNACPVDTQSHSSIECTAPAGSGTGKPVLIAVSGQISPPALYDYVEPPPSIASVTPSSGPTLGGIPLTIAGSNFAASGNSVSVGGNACAVSMEAPSSIVCSLPEGTGLDKEVQVTASGQPSDTELFDYEAPVITSIEPAHGPTAGSIPLTINGNNFGPAGADSVRSVTVGTTACPLVASSSSHGVITCTLPPGQGLGRTVAVDVDSQPSNSATFDYDAPMISSITPGSAPVAGNVPITVVGSNFGLTASVTVAGGTCPITLQSHEELRCTLPPGTGTDVAVLVAVSSQVAMSSFDYVAPACGDGTVDVDEDCDDTNSTDLDGCSAACETEHIESRDQAGCIVAMNKAAAKVMKAQGKDIEACARDAEAGVPCIGVTNSKPLAKALEKVGETSILKCGETPHFGVVPVADVQDANTDQSLALASDLFGVNPDLALVPDAMAPNRASCQQDVLKAVHKHAAARLKAFGKCKKAGLKDEVIRASSQLGFYCLPEIDDEVAVAKATSKQFAALIDSCINVSEDLVLAFPGLCSSAPNVGDCLEERVKCRACRALVATDGLDDDCDGYDDGLLNASCP